MTKHARHITVYYDASCPKCVKDRQNYEHMAGASASDVCWMDITDHDDALQELGIDPRLALTELHVQDKQGAHSLGNRCLYSAYATRAAPARPGLANQPASHPPCLCIFISPDGHPSPAQGRAIINA